MSRFTWQKTDLYKPGDRVSATVNGATISGTVADITQSGYYIHWTGHGQGCGWYDCDLRPA